MGRSCGGVSTDCRRINHPSNICRTVGKGGAKGCETGKRGAPSSTRPARNGCGAGTREGAAQKWREGKRHDNVIRDIDALIAQAPATGSNFGGSEYADASGKKNRCFVMDRDGFMLLAMGFTEEEALKPHASTQASGFATAVIRPTRKQGRAITFVRRENIDNQHVIHRKIWGGIHVEQRALNAMCGGCYRAKTACTKQFLGSGHRHISR